MLDDEFSRRMKERKKAWLASDAYVHKTVECLKREVKTVIIDLLEEEIERLDKEHETETLRLHRLPQSEREQDKSLMLFTSSIEVRSLLERVKEMPECD